MTARETYRIHMNDLGKKDAVPVPKEEYDPRAKTFLGNFPQALSHLALANTAHRLAVGGDGERASLDP